MRLLLRKGARYAVSRGDFVPSQFSEQEVAFLEEFLSRYRGVSAKQLKTRAYLTTPMKAILQGEKNGRDLLYEPIFFGRNMKQYSEEET